MWTRPDCHVSGMAKGCNVGALRQLVAHPPYSSGGGGQASGMECDVVAAVCMSAVHWVSCSRLIVVQTEVGRRSLYIYICIHICAVMCTNIHIYMCIEDAFHRNPPPILQHRSLQPARTPPDSTEGTPALQTLRTPALVRRGA